MPVNPLNPRQKFLTDDVLRLEVAATPDGLVNLCLNPIGEYGGWFWITPTPNTRIISSPVPGFWFENITGGPATWTTDFMPATEDQYVAARCEMFLGGLCTGKIEFYDADKQLISTSSDVNINPVEYALVFIGPVACPSSTAWVKLRFDTSGTWGPGSEIGFTNVAVVAADDPMDIATPRTNLVTNPSFEQDTQGWVSDFFTVARTTTVAAVGSAAAQLTIAGPIPWGKFETALGKLDYGSRYAAQVRMKAASTARRWRLVTSAGHIIGSANVTADDWVTISGTFTWSSVENCYLKLELEPLSENVPTIGEVFYADAFMVERSESVAGYFDGDTTDTADFEYDWTGTPHLSRSTETPVNGWNYVPPFDWRNILGSSLEITCERGELDPGTLTARIHDPALDPAEFPALAPGKRVRLRMTPDDGATWVSLFEGEISDLSVAYEIDRDDPVNKIKPTINLHALDNVARLANVRESRGVALEHLPAILESTGVPWNINGSSNQVATFAVVSTNDNASVLDQVAIARDTALGFAWVDRSGVLCVFDAAEMPTTVVAEFDDETAPSFAHIDVGYDTARVINEVLVNYQRYDPVTGQTENIVYGPFRDHASIASFGPRTATFTVSGTTEDDGVIANYAANILAANATTDRRASSITVPILDTAGLETVAVLDLYDLVHVALTDLVDEDHRVIRMAHRIRPDGWELELGFDATGAVAAPAVVPLPDAPATAPGWIAATLTNGWQNYGAGFEAAAFRRDGNRVTLKGLVRNGTIGAPILTLPQGYRPGNTQMLSGIALGITTGGASAGTAHTHGLQILAVRVDVAPTGAVTMIAPSTGSFTNQYLSLSSISFIADQ